jgi:CRISPR-associated endonuclease/helicase Cas3
MNLTVCDFEEFFRECHGDRPFPWQKRLCGEVLQGNWPRVLGLPTASGKTSLIDIGLFVLAAGAAGACRRIAFVVDRRVVVDEAAERARHLAICLASASAGKTKLVADRLKKLGDIDSPLGVSVLRGGIPPDEDWAKTPSQPVVVLSTVDQIGSRLLFRAYGRHGPRSWPIHAGLLGRDTLVILDEAHCSRPFSQTMRALVERYQGWADVSVGRPSRFLMMSATAGEDPDFVLEATGHRGDVLEPRLTASKLARLVPVKASNDDRAALASVIAKEVGALIGGPAAQPAGDDAQPSDDRLGKRRGRKNAARTGAATEATVNTPQVVGVVVNRVADARAIFEQVNLPPERKLLLTGRTRGLDRDRLLAEWLPRLRASKDRPPLTESVVVVATQCIEVGANLDFDVLVTECAALDSLRQRFGRLNRLGLHNEARATIVGFEKPNEDDPVYGPAIAKTWAYLMANADTTSNTVGRKKVDARIVDFGVDALDATLSTSAPEDGVSALCAPSSNAPLLRPSDLDLLVQTNPRPEPSPDISEFLHGLGAHTSDVTVVWRADLAVGDEPMWAEAVAVQPPSAGEGCPVPIWAAQRWLRGDGAIDPLGYVEGEVDVSIDHAAPNGSRRALRWRGSSDAKPVTADGIKPGDVLVVPTLWGGCDEYGWNPTSVTPATDVGDVAAATYRARPVLRLAKPVTAAWFGSASIDEKLSAGIEVLRNPEASSKQRLSVLDTLASDPAMLDWTKAVVAALKEGGFRFAEAAGAAALIGRPIRAGSDPEVSTSDDNSSATVVATLHEHSSGVEGWARRLASASQLGPLVVEAVAFAGWLHDVGKADPRFQVWLHDGDEVAAAAASALLAKSKTNPRNKAAIERARVRARYPKGTRHEMLSVAMISASPELRDLAATRSLDWDLIVHLVASHHGFARPFAPVPEPDVEPLDVHLAHRDKEAVDFQLRARSDHGLERADSGVADRFWLLVRRYGWHGLAYLEAILRLADHRRSEEEERLALAKGAEEA